MNHQLAKHQELRKLVSIRRDGLDANSIQAFVLDCSAQLVALQYIYDFKLDGLLFLRVEDITEVRSSVTDIFQNALLEQEGLLGRVPFGTKFRLSNWKSLISQLADEHAFMILEREAEPDSSLFIGTVQKVTDREVHGRHFTGVARWIKSLKKLKLNEITSCQVETNYIQVYQRHFERHAL